MPIFVNRWYSVFMTWLKIHSYTISIVTVAPTIFVSHMVQHPMGVYCSLAKQQTSGLPRMEGDLRAVFCKEVPRFPQVSYTAVLIWTTYLDLWKQHRNVNVRCRDAVTLLINTCRITVDLNNSNLLHSVRHSLVQSLLQWSSHFRTASIC